MAPELEQQRDEVRSGRLRELQNHMDRALSESASGEGTDGDQFIKQMLDDLDAQHRRKSG